MDGGAEAFAYCASSGCLNVEGMDDEAEFEDVLLAFSEYLPSLKLSLVHPYITSYVLFF